MVCWHLVWALVVSAGNYFHQTEQELNMPPSEKSLQVLINRISTCVKREVEEGNGLAYFFLKQISRLRDMVAIG
jgi:hypothetical protein